MAHGTRTFRVFVSSTFSDFVAERNALAADVFPELRKVCAAAGCRFQAIDLRWGVGEEAALDQRTMKICLDEIQRCRETSPRPNFIVLLGQRYGWRPLPCEIPEREFTQIVEILSGKKLDRVREWYIRDDNARPVVYYLRPRERKETEVECAREGRKWNAVERVLRAALLEAVRRMVLDEEARLKYEASATHQEIYYGALKAEKPEEHVFAFFRKITKLPQNKSSKDFCDLDAAGHPDPKAAKRLGELKEALERVLGKRPAGNVYEYETTWREERGGPEPSHIKQLCADVHAALAGVILHEIKQVKPEGDLEKENNDHEAFAKLRRRHFRGRAVSLDRIGKYLRGADRHPLAIHGGGGTGKTALMAHAVVQVVPVERPGAKVIQRFIGVTPGSSDGRALLSNLCQEISRLYGADSGAVPSDYRELMEEFGRRLGLATQSEPLVVFLDALDQLSDSEGARSLAWLPERLPEYVWVVVSCLSGEVQRTLEGRPSPGSIVALEPMRKEEGRQVLNLWLKDAGRDLQDAQREHVLERFAARGEPLYLKLAFDEARRWRSDDRVVELESDIPGIIRQMFKRLSADHGGVLVSRSLGYLAAAKHGLTEDEFLDVLARDVDVYTSFLEGAQHVPSDLEHYLLKDLAVQGEAVKAADWLRKIKKDESRLHSFVGKILEGGIELQLPVILWSRLYFDLEHYLTERKADGTSLLTFYHRQIAEVAAEDFLAGDEKRERHDMLARYFLGRARSEIGTDAHSLVEAPYQLRWAGRQQGLAELLTDVPYLHRRSALCDVHALVDDYAMISSKWAAAAQPYRDFVHRHIQRLSRFRGIFFTLVHHEGPPEAKDRAREIAQAGRWKDSWIETVPIVLEAVAAPDPEAPQVDVLAEYDFGGSPVVTLAGGAGLVVFLRRLGSLGVVDLASARELPERVTLRQAPVLRLFPSEDARYLAVAYEDGTADVLELSRGNGNTLTVVVRHAGARYLMPESEPPVMRIIAEVLWYQSPQGGIARLSLREGDTMPERLLPEGTSSHELSGIAVVGEVTITTLRHRGGSTILAWLPSGEVARLERDGADVSCLCSHSSDEVAVAFSDNEVEVFRIGATPIRTARTRSEVLPACMASDGEVLTWIAIDGCVWLWRPAREAHPRAAPVRGSELSAARELAKTADGMLSVATLSKGARLAMRSGHDAGGHKVLAMIDGERERTCLLVVEKPDGPCLVDTATGREIQLAPRAAYLAHFAVDGRRRLLGASTDGRGIIVDLPTFRMWGVEGLPLGFCSLVGDPESGFWVADPAGNLHYLTENGEYLKGGSIGVRPAGNVALNCWPGLLVWSGLCQPDSGPQVGSFAAVLRFYDARRRDGRPQMRRIGTMTMPQVPVLAYDAARSRLLVLEERWGKVVAKWASVRDLAQGHESRCELVGVDPGCHSAIVTPDGRGLCVVCRTGNLFWIDAETFRVRAVFSATDPVTRIAALGPGARWPALVQGEGRVFCFRICTEATQ